MKAQFEQIQPLPENSFKAFLHEVKEFDAPWHYHPEYELTLILRSEGIRYVGNHMEHFGAGDLVLLGPRLPHCWKNTSPGGPARAVVVQWQDNFLGEGWTLKPEMRPIRQLLQLSGGGLRFGKPLAGKLGSALESLPEMPPFRKLLQFLDILHTLAESKDRMLLCEQEFASLDYEDNDRLNTVHNYLKEHYREKISLRDVAGQVHMREEAFSRFFSRIMHRPFFTFLNEYRVNMACKLLIETDQQVAQIGYACGYDSVPYFYRQFARLRGMPPLTYRKRFRQSALAAEESPRRFIPSAPQAPGPGFPAKTN